MGWYYFDSDIIHCGSLWSAWIHNISFSGALSQTTRHNKLQNNLICPSLSRGVGRGRANAWKPLSEAFPHGGLLSTPCASLGVRRWRYTWHVVPWEHGLPVGALGKGPGDKMTCKPALCGHDKDSSDEGSTKQTGGSGDNRAALAFDAHIWWWRGLERFSSHFPLCHFSRGA